MYCPFTPLFVGVNYWSQGKAIEDYAHIWKDFSVIQE